MERDWPEGRGQEQLVLAGFSTGPEGIWFIAGYALEKFGE